MPHIQLPDFSLHYLEHGNGPNHLIFVHGFISSHAWWLPTLEQLDPQIYHAYAIDLRACGQSEQIETGHTLAQYADDLFQFITRLGLEKCTLIGHSMGGGIAMQFALNHQERLNALILVDPLAPFGTTLAPEITAWINVQQGDPVGIRQLVLGAFATAPTGEYLERLVTDGVNWEKPVFLGTMEDMARFSLVEQLPTITVPTLVTWGDKDTVVPFEGIVAAYTGIPGCALEIWHGVGHSGPIEIPARFATLLTSFLQETAAVKG